MNRTDLRLKVFADGADLESIRKLCSDPRISGFTTNPTLMRKAGIDDYESFAKRVLSAVGEKPVSFEVFADDFPEMARQARRIASWGANVYVKVPVTNSVGKSTAPLISDLSRDGVSVNVTAVMTVGQVDLVAEALDNEAKAIVSVFAGRVADTGIDPVPMMKECLAVLGKRPKAELLWASPREVLNVVQANQIGCHIITATAEILNKLDQLGRDLAEFSLETVAMFRADALSAGYSIS